MSATSILAWALISVSTASYNRGNVTHIAQYETKEQCQRVVEFNQKSLPNSVDLTCIKLVFDTSNVQASDVLVGDLLTIPDGRTGLVSASLSDPRKEGMQLIEFQPQGMNRMQFYRVSIPKSDEVTVTR